jgi:hypothetical protein
VTPSDLRRAREANNPNSIECGILQDLIDPLALTAIHRLLNLDQLSLSHQL